MQEVLKISQTASSVRLWWYWYLRTGMPGMLDFFSLHWTCMDSLSFERCMGNFALPEKALFRVL